MRTIKLSLLIASITTTAFWSCTRSAHSNASPDTRKKNLYINQYDLIKGKASFIYVMAEDKKGLLKEENVWCLICKKPDPVVIVRSSI